MYDLLDCDVETDYAIEYLVSPAVHATQIPNDLSADLAAPLLCGEFLISAHVDLPLYGLNIGWIRY